VLHRQRPDFSHDHPIHVTFRIRRGLPSLRRPRFHRAFRQALLQVANRHDTFRVVHYSVQKDHVHCLIEAEDKQALSNGMKSLGARFARTVNRVFERIGPVLDGRYHARVLKTPREVRKALAYVLLNARKHFQQRHGHAPPIRLDPCSSGVWFQGWKTGAWDPPAYRRETGFPLTWLLSRGWRRCGLVDPGEVPGSLAGGST
jgi:REP element-mobilizing transposase RayT